MIIAIANQAGAGGALVANNLAVLRARSGRKVVLLDTDPKRPACTWSSARGAADVRPRIPARALGDARRQSALTDLLLHYNDVLIDAVARDTPESRTALAAARLVVVPVCAHHIDLATQYKLIGRLSAARLDNPRQRVLLVIVSGESAPCGEALAAIRAYVSRIVSASLAATVIHAPHTHDYGQGHPDMAAEMHALYREVYAANNGSAGSAAYP